jgi:mono/diheme cytochrome c family protein
MRRRWIILASGALALAGELNAATITADSSRGSQLFAALDCLQCHSINGQGGHVGPDLGKRIDRGFTPAMLAATMWNHAPAMWSAMRQQDVTAGRLDEQGAMDLFAYFYSAHFFDRLGDAGRGKQVFSQDHCAACHGLTEAKNPAAKPVSEWSSLGQPIELVNAMWNHAATMRPEFAKRKLSWPELTSQDLTDLLVYVRNLPATRYVTTRLEITAGANGKTLFTSKGCAGCHSAGNPLGPKLKGMTLNDIAVAMWNHEPAMSTHQANTQASAPRLEPGEMSELVSYLWAARFFEDQGNARAGERVFVTKHCATCHINGSGGGSGGAPKLTGAGRTYTGATIVSALWSHGPRMLEEMKGKGVAWPRFEDGDMSNLIAYLQDAAVPNK